MVLETVLYWFFYFLELVAHYVHILISGTKSLPYDLRSSDFTIPKTVEISASSKPEQETGILRNSLNKDQFVAGSEYDNMNLFFASVVNKNKSKRAISFRRLKEMHAKQVKVKDQVRTWFVPEFYPSEHLTFEQAYQQVTKLAHALRSTIGLKPRQFVGFYEETCWPWLQMAHACFASDVVPVTVYATLGVDGLCAAINETQMSVLFMNEKAKDDIKAIVANCPSIRWLIVHTEQDLSSMNEFLSKYGAKIITFSELQASVTEDVQPLVSQAKRTDLAMIMYTSGTTGAPKGVQMLHQNIIASIHGISSNLGDLSDIELRYLAFLPLAHILEICAEHVILMRGGNVCYGSPRTLTADSAKPKGDFAEYQPTVMASVPKVLETIRKKSSEKIEKGSAVLKLLFNVALRVRRDAIFAGRDAPIVSRIVFSKFTEATGGKLRVVLVGGSAVSKETQEFMRVALGCPVIQGYGLTETCASGGVQPPQAPFTSGIIGRTVPSVEMKLVSIPDMKYFANEGNGELWIRGPPVCTLGYYKQPEKSAQDFDSQGWFHTGDICHFDKKNGTIAIIDRLKNLAKLSHGEYIAVEHLESIYTDSAFVSICMVYADSHHDYPVALIVPEEDYLVHYAKTVLGKTTDDLSELAKDPQVKRAVLDSLKEVGRAAGFKSIEIVQNVGIVPERWTTENGMLTAAQKLKRQDIIKKYKDEIEKLYKE
jgi:long-chain acyl-CoA synthetase